MSRNAFFIDPFCDVIPCNGMAKKAVMGNLREQSWEELWNSKQAQEVRAVCLLYTSNGSSNALFDIDGTIVYCFLWINDLGD